MTTSNLARVANREAAEFNWDTDVPLQRHAGLPFDILGLLAKFGHAADSNPQLAILLETRGKVAFFEFLLYAKDRSAAFTHYLVAQEPILARTGQAYHNPAECERREIGAVDTFVALLNSIAPLDAAAPTGSRTTQGANAQHAPDAP